MLTLIAIIALSAPPSCDCAGVCPCVSCVCGVPAKMTYREVRTVVECGMEIVVYAGVPLPKNAEANAVRVDAIPNEPAGVYRCWRVNGEAKYEPRASVSKTPTATPTPSAVVPLQELIFPAAGNCPNGQCPAPTRIRKGR